MMAHTPTPWRVEDGTTLIWGKCDPDDKTTYGMGYPVARLEHPYSSSRLPTPEEQDANAALIVNAVNNHADLLATLKAVRTLLHDELLYRIDDRAVRSEADAVLGQIDAAIARAEGGGS
jgi:hypothetical protein